MRRRNATYAATFLLALPLFLAACGGSEARSPASSEVRGSTSSVRELYNFDSLPVMVATADVVVVGTVTGTREGRTVGEGDSALSFTEVSVRADDVLKGAAAGETVLLEVDEPGASSNTGNTDWLTVGSRSVFFLQRKDEGTGEAYYRPVNSQGVYQVASDGRNLVAAGRDEFSARVAALSLAALRSEVAHARRQIAAGEVKPQEPSLSASRRGQG